MFLDSETFNIQTMSSHAIGPGLPDTFRDRIAPVLDQLIQALPETDASIELRLRSVVDILIVSKLQAEVDRADLERIKYMILHEQLNIAAIEPVVFGAVVAFCLDRWVMLAPLKVEGISAEAACNDIEAAIEHFGMTKHYIVDFAWSDAVANQMLGYFLGARSMLASFGGKFSIVWLPTIALSASTQALLVSRFNFLKKGRFLLSRPERKESKMRESLT